MNSIARPRTGATGPESGVCDAPLEVGRAVAEVNKGCARVFFFWGGSGFAGRARARLVGKQQRSRRKAMFRARTGSRALVLDEKARQLNTRKTKKKQNWIKASCKGEQGRDATGAVGGRGVGEGREMRGSGRGLERRGADNWDKQAADVTQSLSLVARRGKKLVAGQRSWRGGAGGGPATMSACGNGPT